LLSQGPSELKGLGNPAARRTEDIPQGARFEARNFACSAGSRRYRLYVPSSLEGTPNGVLIMLHGCTQDPEDFAAGTGMHIEAEAHRLVVAWPEQTRGDNVSACWNWFRPGDQCRDIGEPAILAGIAREVANEFGVDARRTFVAGLSAGGAMAHVLAVTYSDVFGAAGVHSGLAHGAASDVASAFAAMRGGNRASFGPAAVPLIVFHGTSDATVHPSNARHVTGAISEGTVQRDAVAGGRHYTRATATDVEGRAVELWLVEGAGHAWSGGRAEGSYTDPSGPNASAEMVRFFMEQAVQS
jgi:poly(hydroxyalkanoate) depolymerase family esterase